jgi:ketosteroid isomerase-like protein
MSEEDDAIRRLVGRWADAVHRGDIDGVLADHAQDIVMSDVPPPHEVVAHEHHSFADTTG